ncbi:ribonuclease H-like domain-containing protein [Dichotomocladium elegans]|nr:ribonuclease H-like domain-containing protein [Dichotomocladium elegans]
MEISRHQFHSLLPTVKEAIDECEFIAIDTELSGLHRPEGSKRMDTLANRYAEYREATQRFMIIQFGLCTFKWDEPAGRYIAKPFNFYIFPTSMTGKVHANRLFLTQAQAFDFLAKQGFDFNKASIQKKSIRTHAGFCWVYQGIPYLTVKEEEAFAAEAKRKLEEDWPDIKIDEKEIGFVEAARDKIKKWVEDPKKGDDHDGVNIDARNAYQRRLIYQEVRNKYPELTAEGRSGFIRVMRLTDAQRKRRTKEQLARIKKDCEGAAGFRKVIDMISASRKPVVGHNMLLDICHIIGQFVEPLPEDLGDFKRLAHKVFPYMADTKHICASSPLLQPIIGTATSLEVLRFETNLELFSNPRIDMAMEFPRYINDMAHEAGYDAYITGAAFLKIHSYMEMQINPPKPPAPAPEPEVPEEEKKTRGRRDENGWDISDDEEEDDQNWLAEEEEEVYNYGSTYFPLRDKAGAPTAVLAEYVNKAAMVRTGYVCFDFVNAERIDVGVDGFHILLPTRTGKAFPTEEALSEIFAEYGKYAVEMIDEMSAFVFYENLRGGSSKVKPLLEERLSGTPCEGLVIQTIVDYCKVK